MRQNRVIILGGIGVVVLVTAITILLAAATRNTELELVVVPAAASLTLDGKPAKAGKQIVVKGKHTVTASMSGFASASRTVTVGGAASSIHSVRIIIVPNSDKGRQYMADHPEEQSLIESYDGQNFDDENAIGLANNPITALLPHIAPDNSYRIDAGPISDTKLKATIYITAVNSRAAAAAKTWISSKGYKLTSLSLSIGIEPLLNKLPYKTTDFTINSTYTLAKDGTQKMGLDIALHLSGADRSNADAASAGYKQEALDQLRSFGVDPASYTITYTVN